MSQENLEFVRSLYPGGVDLVGVLDYPAALRAIEPLVQPDFETVTVPGQVPLSGAGAPNSSRPIFYGPDGFIDGFREWLSAWESWVISPTEFIEMDQNRVLVMLEGHARSKTHHVEMPIEGANLVTLRDGKLARLELFFDRRQPLEAAGLWE
jgi:hypothetical protein